MPRSIRKPVGIGFKAVNHAPDVMVVQEALNDVTPAEGGPQPILVVDGVCGSKTKKAIQKFQLHHFGWKGADGRVDPNGRTLEKLNEIAGKGPAVATAFQVFETRSSGTLLVKRPGDWFFLVELISFRHPFPHAVFWFGPSGMAPLNVPAKSQFLGNAHSILRTPRRCALGELSGPALIRDIFDPRIKDERLTSGSTMETLPPHPLRFNCFLPVGMDPDEQGRPGVVQFQLAGLTITEYRGTFQIVS